MEKNCATHGNRALEFVCLAPRCTRNTAACILCLKHGHAGCEVEYVLHASELGRLSVARTGLNVPEIVAHHFQTQVARNSEATAQAFKDLKARTLKTLEFSSYHHEDVLYLNNIDRLKQNYKVFVHKDGDIVFTPKMQADMGGAGAMIRNYKEKVNAAVSALVRDLAELEVDRVHQLIDRRLFIGSASYRLDFDNAREMIRVTGSETEGKHRLLVYPVPLTKTAVKFSVSLIDKNKEVNLEDKFVTVGLLSDKTLSQLRKQDGEFALASFEGTFYVSTVADTNFKVVERLPDDAKRSYLCPGHSAVLMFSKKMSGQVKCELTDFSSFRLEKSFVAAGEYYLFVGSVGEGVEVEISQNFV